MNATNKNAIAVYTAIFGKKDHLWEPLTPSPGCDFICFTDQPFHSRTWRVVPVKAPLPDSTRSARRYKVLAHEYLPEYQMSVWVDGNVLIQGNVGQLVGLSLTGTHMAVPDHSKSAEIPLSSVHEGLERLLSMEKIGKRQDDPKVMSEQYAAYRADGFPDAGGLLWSLVLLRRHNEPDVKNAMRAWWSEIERWSKRDQMSFNYVAWKNQFPFAYLPFDPADNPYFKRVSHYLPWYRKLYSYWLGALKRIANFF